MQTSPHFRPLTITGRNLPPDQLDASGCTQRTKDNRAHLPLGTNTFWGIPFDCGGQWVYADNGTVKLDFEIAAAPYFVFLHACEIKDAEPGGDGLYSHFSGTTPLMAPVCDYVIHYDDGMAVTIPIRARMEIHNMNARWGESPLLSRSHVRGTANVPESEAYWAGLEQNRPWGESLSRSVMEGDMQTLQQWLYAFENPHPDKAVAGMDIVKKEGNVFLFAVTAGDVKAHPLCYGRRQKALFSISGEPKDLLAQVDIDMGHIIAVTPRPVYDNARWETGDMTPPDKNDGKYIVEFDAHEDAVLYIGEERVPVKELSDRPENFIANAEHAVTLKVLDQSGKTIPARVHAHGAAGEYLPPRGRHRYPNVYWFEDYSADYCRDGHCCTYINGNACYLLPLGEVYFEVAKGFEYKPVRQRFTICPDTKEIIIRLQRLVDWRCRGWITADTHVHFLSPHTALLEAGGEGVNVTNLLVTQWGELITNLGDFTGTGALISPDGETIVSVGSENRQPIMGHISLLGYEGGLILPLSAGGPYEAAMGEPVEVTLTQWAARCKAQNGITVIPHFPFPRLENAAAIVCGHVDAVEVMGSDIGINQLYLSDWYRYLNCGFQVAAVGGTDKMRASTAIGAMRTYSKINGPLTLEAWKESIAAGRCFASGGALVDMRVNNHEMGGAIKLEEGGTLNIEWDVASAAMPLTYIELVRNGTVVVKQCLNSLIGELSDSFTVNENESAWFALRVRGIRPGGNEIISAHTSAFFVIVKDKPLFNKQDAATIMDQIEGSIAFVETLGIKARDEQYKAAIDSLTNARKILQARGATCSE